MFAQFGQTSVELSVCEMCVRLILELMDLNEENKRLFQLCLVDSGLSVFSFVAFEKMETF